MPKTKYIVVSDCRIDGQHTPKGTLLDLDMDDPREATKIAYLNHAGRIGVATPENRQIIEAEIRAEKEQSRQSSQIGKRPAMAAA